MSRRWKMSDFVALVGGLLVGNGLFRFFTDPWQHAAAVLLVGALLVAVALVLAYGEWPK